MLAQPGRVREVQEQEQEQEACTFPGVEEPKVPTST